MFTTRHPAAPESRKVNTMSNFTNMSPANVTNLLSTKTPALITIYSAIVSHVNPAHAPAFTTKSPKLQIVTAINTILADADITYEMVQAEIAGGIDPIVNTPHTTEQNIARPQGDNGGPIYPTPTDAERAIAAATIKRLRKNDVSDETIRATLSATLSAPDATHEDGTTSHGVATAALAILDNPTTTRATTTRVRTPITPNDKGRTSLAASTVLLSAAANPKTQGKANYARYQSMLDGCTFPCTVQTVLENSQATRGDLLWDIRYGFITIQA